MPPLLLATMTTYSLFANPVTYLRNMTHDILRMLLRLPELPSAYNPVSVASALESLSLSLSSCIFHSLCGGHEDQLLETIRRGEIKIIGKENKEGKFIFLNAVANISALFNESIVAICFNVLISVEQLPLIVLMYGNEFVIFIIYNTVGFAYTNFKIL